jgi:hypothetical protein
MIRVLRLGRMRWAENVARIGEKRKAHMIFLGRNLQEIVYLKAWE